MYKTKIQAAIYGTFKEQIDTDIADKMKQARLENNLEEKRRADAAQLKAERAKAAAVVAATKMTS